MIFISYDDARYLLKELDLTPELRQVLENFSIEGGKVNDEQADELRDLCNEKLDVCGLDVNYNLNEDGKLLETLADKLYV